MAVTITFQGDKALERKLAKLPAVLKQKIVRAGLLKAGKVIRDQAKENAPKKTGALSESIRERAYSNSQGDPVVVVETKAGFFKGKQFYGAFQEFGWRKGKRVGLNANRKGSHKRGVNAAREKVPGKHFIKRAFESKGEEAAQVAVVAIRDALEKEAMSGS